MLVTVLRQTRNDETTCTGLWPEAVPSEIVGEMMGYHTRHTFQRQQHTTVKLKPVPGMDWHAPLGVYLWLTEPTDPLNEVRDVSFCARSSSWDVEDLVRELLEKGHRRGSTWLRGNTEKGQQEILRLLGDGRTSAGLPNGGQWPKPFRWQVGAEFFAQPIYQNGARVVARHRTPISAKTAIGLRTQGRKLLRSLNRTPGDTGDPPSNEAFFRLLAAHAIDNNSPMLTIALKEDAPQELPLPNLPFLYPIWGYADLMFSLPNPGFWPGPFYSSVRKAFIQWQRIIADAALWCDDYADTSIPLQGVFSDPIPSYT